MILTGCWLIIMSIKGVAERREASKGPTIFDDPWVGNKLFSEFLTAHVSLKLGVASFLKAVLVARAV